MKITYLGHSTCLVEAGGKKVIIDPFLTGNPVAQAKPEEIEVDAVLLTHGHGDHCKDALAIAKRNDCVIVSTYEVAQHFGDLGAKAHGLGHGGAYQFEWGRVKMTLAFHGGGIDLEDGSIKYGGNPAGILLTMEGKTFYHAGDTALFGDMKLIGEYHKIDVAALPIGDNYTMGPDDAAVAASFLNPGLTFPIHYNTFPLLEQNAQEWIKTLAKRNLKGAAPWIGESVEV